MGIITDLIGNYQRTKLAEQQQKVQQIGREVQVNRAVLSAPDLPQDDPGFAQQKQDKQAAAQNLDRLLDQYGGPQAKTHRPMISNVLRGLASGVLGGLGVQRPGRQPQTPARTGPPPAFDPQALVPGAVGTTFGQLQPPGQLATLAGPRPGALRPLQAISPDALRSARLSVLAGNKTEQAFDEQRQVLAQALQRGDITQDQYREGIREALQIKPDPVAQAKAIEQAKLDIDDARAAGDLVKARARLESIKNLLSPDEYARARTELETGIKLSAGREARLPGTLGELAEVDKILAAPAGTYPASEVEAAKEAKEKLTREPAGVATAKEAQDEAEEIAGAIMRGEQDPNLQGLSRSGVAGRVRTILGQNGYNLLRAQNDLLAARAFIRTANSSQQVRLMQATEFTLESLNLLDNPQNPGQDLIGKLRDQIPRTKYPVLNRAAITAAANGLFGDDAAAAAQNMLNQIKDLQSELAVVYMGGNTPTDKGLSQAQDQLQGEWSDKVLRSSIDLARKNLGLRINSIRRVGPAGMSAEGQQQYGGVTGGPTPTPSPTSPATGAHPRTADDYLKSIGVK